MGLTIFKQQRRLLYICSPHNAQPSLPSFMGQPTVIFPHHSWASRRWLKSQILSDFMGQPMQNHNLANLVF
jgi:hypothetical protein